MSEETIIYEKDEIKVTNLRAVFGEKTYSIANITAVEAVTAQSMSGCVPFFFIGIGFLIMMFGNGGNVSLFTGVALLLIGPILYFSAKPNHVVKISTASGEVKAYTSGDKSTINKIVSALNDAMVKKG